MMGPGDDLLRRFTEGPGGGSVLSFQEVVPVPRSEDVGLATGEFCLPCNVFSAGIGATVEAKVGFWMVMEGMDTLGSLRFRKDDSAMFRCWLSGVWVDTPADSGCEKRDGPCSTSVDLGGKVELWMSSRKDC